MKKIFYAVALLLLPFMGQSQNTDGDAIFETPVIHTIYFTFTQPSFYDSLINTHLTDGYIRAAMVFDGEAIDSIGVKFKGNSSFNNNSVKKSMKVDMNEYVSGQTIDGLKKFNLNNGFKDPTMIREKITLDFLNAQGIAAPRCSYAKVYFNNTYWGLYTLVEEVNKSFLDDRFGDNDGNLFKGDPHGSLNWQGSAASQYYDDYELETNETENNWTDLVWLCDKINNTPTAQFHDSLEKAMDTDLFIKQWAALSVFVNLDSYIGSGHNYFIYHDSTKLKFNWISWDVNEAFGTFSMGMQLPAIKTLDMFYLNSPTQKPLCNKMLQNAQYKQDLADEICYMVHTYFTTGWFYPRIDSIADAIRDDLYADPNKFFSNQQFETNIDSDINQTAGLKSFITARRASLLTQLATWNCSAPTAINSTDVDGLKMYPNPATGIVVIEFPQTQKAGTVIVFNAMGQQVNQYPVNGDKLIVDVSTYPKGMYFVSTGAGKANKLLVE